MKKEFFQVIEPDSLKETRWADEHDSWPYLTRGLVAEGVYNPLTMKCLYVTGVILQHCRSVTILLSKENSTSTTYYPAFVLFCSSVELLGRCLRGNQGTGNARKDLTAGFQWISHPNYPGYEDQDLKAQLFSSSNYKYSIEDLVNIRNFAAHGQAKLSDLDKEYDYLVLESMPELFGAAVSLYLVELTSREALAIKLARAGVTPYRSRPIFESVWDFRGEDLATFPEAVGNEIADMDWNYRHPMSGTILEV